MNGKQILALLGKRLPPGKSCSDSLYVADAISSGLPQRSIQQLKKAMALTDTELAAIMGMSQKTISRLRKKPNVTLGPVPSDRLYRLAALYSMAREVLGGDEQARDWLKSPQIGLNNRIPLELLTTEVGAREVENLLGRIEYGVLS